MPEVQKPKVYAAGTKTAGKTCTICQTVILAGEEIVYCPDCVLPFHRECWGENRGCSQYGCKSAPKTIKAESVSEVSTGWGGEKKCPSCGRTIKSGAIKCRFCGAEFETREEISASQFAQREYAGRDYEKARNKVISLFLVSATGCLAPVALVMLGLLVFRKKAIGVDYLRLPPALKGVAVCGFGVGCLMVALFVLFAAFD